ncbi:acylneuraminate cytidylyltransferase family protein [Bacteroidia bacterium]|nr:acylneuraminate cytidylyltransferase family protein [Bacteroidia bacterium]
MNNIVAILPMKHTSTRVPGKNYRAFGDKMLFEHILLTMLACEKIDLVVVDTDSQTIMDKIATDYPKVKVLERPEHLRPGDTPMNDVLLNTISQVPSKFYLQTHSTNPLLTQKSIDAAIDKFEAKFPIYDSLFSVTRLQTRLWNELALPMNHNPNILSPTQDLPPVYEENSCIYLFTEEILRKKHNRIGDRPMMHEIEPIEAQDIDTEQEYLIAEAIYLNNFK